jgi:hypothetical protein
MNTDKTIRKHVIGVYLCSSVALFSFLGCAKPNTVNIDLRKQIDQLQSQAEYLKRLHAADQATIAGMKGATTIPTLGEDRLSELFTTHGLKFGRITGGWDTDPDKPGDKGLQIAIVPTDDQGQPLKAAGSFDVEAFDLAKSKDNRIGHWTFDLQQTRDAWLGQAMMYSYVLKSPWQRVPEHEQITVRVTFTDALTGRKFTEQREVRVKLPLTTNS